jgi:hypothetical protein
MPIALTGRSPSRRSKRPSDHRVQWLRSSANYCLISAVIAMNPLVSSGDAKMTSARSPIIPAPTRESYAARVCEGTRSPWRESSSPLSYLSGRRWITDSSSGLPNTAGMRSSRNRNRCALTPIVRPPSLLSGMIASAATCQVSATYASPGFIVAAVFSPRGVSNANSTSGMN